MVVPTADSDFCHEVVAKGWLTQEQIEHAAKRYKLGRSRSGRTIFWMIDQNGNVRDGRIGDDWVSEMMRRREPELLKDCHTTHCLFGMHLLNECPATTGDACESKNDNGNRPVGIVEKETSAVVLSEIFPDYIWLATSPALSFTIDRLKPLKGHHVIVFPPTDPHLDSYVTWLDLVSMTRKEYQLDITVSDCLEDNTSAEQKERRIDLAEYLFEAAKRPG